MQWKFQLETSLQECAGLNALSLEEKDSLVDLRFLREPSNTTCEIEFEGSDGFGYKYSWPKDSAGCVLKEGFGNDRPERYIDTLIQILRNDEGFMKDFWSDDASSGEREIMLPSFDDFDEPLTKSASD